MMKIEPRVEYAAQEITAADFEEPFDFSRVKGVLYRNETRTARLMNETELHYQNVDLAAEDVDADDDRPTKTYAASNRPKGSPRTPGAPGPHSFYGIGCFIIMKNGKPIDIVNPQKLKEIYRAIP